MHQLTDMIAHTTAFVTPVVEHWMEREIAQWVHHAGSRLRGETAEKLTACRFVSLGVRCISIERVFAYGAMGHRIDPPWWTH